MTNVIAPGRGAETWHDRIREAAYTSPSGIRITFMWETLESEFEKRAAAFEFPGVDGSYIQPNGFSSRRYPMRCIFNGVDHDLIATAFEKALTEEGIGRLEHPLRGAFDVIPFGRITRRNDLKTEANQSIVEVEFWTTIRVLYPSAAIDPENEIAAAIANFDVVAAQQFANATDLRSAIAKANGKLTFRKLLQGVSAALEQVSGAVTSVNRSFRDLQSEVNFGIDVLIGQPLLLAQQISNLIKAPARALAGIDARLEGYGNLADSIFGSSAGQPGRALTSGTTIALRTTQIANDFRIADLMAMATIAGSVVSVTAPPVDESGQEIREPVFRTRPQALAAADEILNQFDALIAWRDAGFSSLDLIGGVHGYQVDTGEAYQALQGVVALTAGYLVQLGFSLATERAVVLDRPRTVLDLSAELYGSVDDILEFFIASNDFTGAEILEIPRGRTVVYYPEAR